MATVKQEQIIDVIANLLIESVDNDDNSVMLIDQLPKVGINRLDDRLEITDEIYSAIREAICSTLRKYL